MSIWRWLYRKWPTPQPLTEGYTPLVMVPGDLPVFLDLSLGVFARQERDHMAEILVIPDMPSPNFAAHVETCRRRYPTLPMRLVTIPPLGRWSIRKLDNPHHNHWMQLITGTAACRTRYALMHDADLFIEDTDFLETHYAEAQKRDAVCMGVSPVWDEWFREQGFNHITATWELLFRVDWARGFPPHLHRGHEDVINGKRHAFDTLLMAQCLTDPSRIARHEREWGFVHFNYVICTYRHFQKRQGAFEDNHFRLLLIRLLIDACDTSGWTYEVPPLGELHAALRTGRGEVTYTDAATAANYLEFREKVQQLLAGPVLSERQRAIIAEGVAPFDAAFSWVTVPTP
jgi:hypothetical protein